MARTLAWPNRSRILHSIEDDGKAVNPDHYFDGYRLAVVLLAYLDSALN